ncbi:hypothetical protein ACHAWF_005370 [Thalassiosira exigua]
MNRRPFSCMDVEDQRKCVRRGPPKADYPNFGLPGTVYSDLLTYDIKVPGEHTLEGRSFDAEIQMLHSHPTANRPSSIGILVEASEVGYNDEFQAILDEFQRVYGEHMDECHQRLSRTSEQFWKDLGLAIDYSLVKPKNVEEVEGQSRNATRRFNPYHDALMPTIFFYRYWGSITEPPCKDIEWFVLHEPMKISTEQLHQLRRLLFTHIDGKCRPTSVHNRQQSVARPIFPMGEWGVEHCAPGEYVSDAVSGIGAGKQCQ